MKAPGQTESGQQARGPVFALPSLAAFSPDGTKIVFSSGRSGTDALWTINANGTSPTQLTKNPNVDDFAPSWGIHP